MKKMIKSCAVAVLAFGALLPVRAFAVDAYDTMASELAEGAGSLTNKKVAILPFAYVDGRKSQGGTIISERLTTRLIKMRKLEVVERNLLDKVMGELKLQTSGAIDSSSAKELGKLLGVEAIVTGSLVETQRGKVEVNARFIKTETAQAIMASTVILDKDWVDESEEVKQPQQPQYQQPQYQEPEAYKQAPPSRGRGNGYGFFDVFTGFGATKMDLEFSNSLGNIAASDLGIFGYTGTRRSVGFEGLETGGNAGIAMRVGGYGNSIIGGDLEMSYESHNVTKQQTTWKLNGIQQGNFNFFVDDYLTVKTFAISGDLLLRVPNARTFEPYMGIGLGMSFNSITAPYVKGYTQSSVFSTPTEDFGLGFVFRVPIGVRIKVAENFNLLTEFRYQLNTFTFDRGVKSEKDTVTLKGARLLIGMGFTF